MNVIFIHDPPGPARHRVPARWLRPHARDIDDPAGARRSRRHRSGAAARGGETAARAETQARRRCLTHRRKTHQRGGGHAGLCAAREVSDPADVVALHAELEPNTQIFAYRLDPAEASRLAAFRDALKKKQEASGRRGGNLTITVRPDACRAGDLPDRPVYITTYLKTAETGGYVPLARDVDLRTIVPGRDVTQEIPACP